MAPRRLTRSLTLVLLVVALFTPLKAQPTTPTGFLQVNVTTSGPVPDVYYDVAFGSQILGTVMPNGSSTFRMVPADSRAVTLRVPESCTVRGRHPREVVVSANEVVGLEFAVDCAVPGMEERQRVREEAAAAPPVERQVQRPQRAAQDAQLGQREHMPRVTTTVKVRAYGQTGGWGTEATIHNHQEVMFLWDGRVEAATGPDTARQVQSVTVQDIGMSEAPFAEWQVWNQNPEERSVPESAKLATGVLEVTGETTSFPIHFSTFVPVLPPQLPAEQKYWVTVRTKDAHGTEIGYPPTPATVSFRACSNNQQCPEGYFCDPDKKVCDKIEVFCAAAREIPGYKGTGYKKGDWGGHIQGTDGSSVRCYGYRCMTLPDGTPQCLCRCRSTGNCDYGYSCTSDNRCVMN